MRPSARPDLMRAIKRSVDADRRAGRFLLTGSADLLALPTLSDSLAGRMERVQLLPLSPAEIACTEPAFLDALFEGRIVRGTSVIGEDLIDVVLTGGFPEMVRRATAARRRAWARDYVAALVERDVRDIADVVKIDEMRHLIRAVAPMAGQITNFTSLGAQVGLDTKTAQRYVALLENLYLLRRIPSWSRNALKRVIKSPKLAFYDSGLHAALRGLTVDQIREDKTPLGALLESFVVSELLKQSTWTDRHLQISHFRTKDGTEVDIVLEDEQGALVALEVKAAATVTKKDFRGLEQVKQATGKSLRAAAVLYDGKEAVPFGDRQWALPLSWIWTGA